MDIDYISRIVDPYYFTQEKEGSYRNEVLNSIQNIEKTLTAKRGEELTHQASILKNYAAKGINEMGAGSLSSKVTNSHALLVDSTLRVNWLFRSWPDL